MKLLFYRLLSILYHNNTIFTLPSATLPSPKEAMTHEEQKAEKSCM